MRLICPNCGAEYEVPDDVIPEAGRDVQCSNCGHTWFERPGASVAAEEGLDLPDTSAEPPMDEPDDNDPWGTPGETDAPLPDDAVADDTEEAARSHDDDDAADSPDDDAAVEPPADEPGSAYDIDAPEPGDAEEEDGVDMPAPPSRDIDPEIAEMLREEAALAAAARASSDPDPLEYEPDLGLDDPADDEDRRAAEARRRLALLKGEDTAEGTTARGKDALPPIDDVSADLGEPPAPPTSPAPAAVPDDGGAAEDGERRYRRGFRRGFVLVMALVAIGALVYAYAPQIADRVPALAGPLEAYVERVDAGRLWLDLKLQDLTARLNG